MDISFEITFLRNDASGDFSRVVSNGSLKFITALERAIARRSEQICGKIHVIKAEPIHINNQYHSGVSPVPPIDASKVVRIISRVRVFVTFMPLKIKATRSTRRLRGRLERTHLRSRIPPHESIFLSLRDLIIRTRTSLAFTSADC